MGTTRMGDYLRARRGQLKPEDVGLHSGGRRRVEGLRREEVAMLAGISPEYYLRLEQGRDQRPSDQVIAALAGALRLDADGISYLDTIARPARPPSRAPTAETAGPHVQSLIDGWPRTAAYVQGRGFTVLAANRLAVALTEHFAPGAVPLKAAFLAPDMRALYRNWDAMTAKTVPFLRSVAAGHEDDPEVAALITELTQGSERFRTLWERHDVKVRDEGATELDHPLVGHLDLRYQKLVLPESDHLLVTYHAEPGSPSEEPFHRLADLAAQREAGEIR
ncbi:transcriptional regulator [Brachybacterium endophyticum]|uniref:Transcriptional regulator n=1 Tax=Brachybacterium endophyticum TaxID=2182385 RepID=A0A2U2RI75_9MICO|nr:helix-turn-helix transcriptional regulator [Brachybacterium endophyticum]PWH05592.1 transcriptional regulator [Brachybacterium endophyticum]